MSVFALAAVAGGCQNSAQVFQDKNEGGFFSNPIDIFAKPDWARPSDAKPDDMTARPVGPDDLVGGDGRCITAVAPASAPGTAAASTPTAGDSAGGMAGELRSAPAPAADTSAPPVLGGIGLGMTECQTVQRAGVPGNVNISAGNKGQRLVVLTYLSGSWPGIYHFTDGRLCEIDRAPQPPAPPKPPPKKPAKKKPAADTSQRGSVQ